VLYNAYCLNLAIEQIDNMDLDKRRAIFLMLTEVVGSTPTRSISFTMRELRH
jgi:hypothetical protein